MTLYEIIDEVKADGIAIGEERGALQKAYETARNLFSKGMDIDFICDVTGLSVEQLNAIADEMNAENY